jgi:hypothetical protein
MDIYRLSCMYTNFILQYYPIRTTKPSIFQISPSIQISNSLALMSSPQQTNPKDKGKGKTDTDSRKQNNLPTSGFASNLTLPNPFNLLKKRSWKQGLKENEDEHIQAAERFEEEDAIRSQISDEMNSENAALNTGMDETGVLMKPTLGKYFNKTAERAQRVKNLVMNPKKFDGICGVEMSGKKLCRQDLTCGKHTLEMKRGVVGRSRPFDELLGDFKEKSGGKSMAEDQED